jgi:hypothetical protein
MDAVEIKLYNKAFLLSLFTIFYNLFEGILSMVLGVSDETLSLFGFGADSFIEVISGIGIAIMIMRIRQNPDSHRSSYEVTALKITGTAFLSARNCTICRNSSEPDNPSQTRNYYLGCSYLCCFNSRDDMAYAGKKENRH